MAVILFFYAISWPKPFTPTSSYQKDWPSDKQRLWGRLTKHTTNQKKRRTDFAFIYMPWKNRKETTTKKGFLIHFNGAMGKIKLLKNNRSKFFGKKNIPFGGRLKQRRKKQWKTLKPANSVLVSVQQK